MKQSKKYLPLEQFITMLLNTKLISISSFVFGPFLVITQIVLIKQYSCCCFTIYTAIC